MLLVTFTAMTAAIDSMVCPSSPSFVSVPAVELDKNIEAQCYSEN